MSRHGAVAANWGRSHAGGPAAGVDDAAGCALLVERSAEDACRIGEALADPAGPPSMLKWAAGLPEALRELKTRKYQLILLSLGLPDGLDILAFDRIRRAAPAIPVVVLCSESAENVAIEALRRGADDYLVKWRLDGPDMTHRLRSHLKRSGTLSALEAARAAADGAESRRLAALAQAGVRVRGAARLLRQVAESLGRTAPAGEIHRQTMAVRACAGTLSELAAELWADAAEPTSRRGDGLGASALAMDTDTHPTPGARRNRVPGEAPELAGSFPSAGFHTLPG